MKDLTQDDLQPDRESTQRPAEYEAEIRTTQCESTVTLSLFKKTTDA
jgi:hypothetical protein